MTSSFRLAAPIVALIIGSVAPATAHDIVTPPDNPSSPIKIELERRLFYEADLSINGTMACATCHGDAIRWP